MGRPERLLNPTLGPLQQFAYDLRQLRRQAGAPSYRELSRKARYSVTALSEAAGGEALPTLEVTLAYVAACGGERDEWRSRWLQTVQQLAGSEHSPGAQGAETTEIRVPYLGLSPFQMSDADLYFGRNKTVEDLRTRLAKQPFLAVVGASGSGKSSLLRAGLIPALAANSAPDGGDGRIVLFCPGERPLRELAVHVAAPVGVAASSLHVDLQNEPTSIGLVLRQLAVSRSPRWRPLLAIDQFEEVFTLCQDAGERDRFIDALLSAAAGPDSAATVVLTIRADFYSHCAQHPGLATAVQNEQVLLTAMEPDDLRAVITQPAGKAGLTVDPALVATILSDVVGQPGMLPLLSHALLETWRHRQGRRLTLASYQAVGGVKGAIAQTAEQVYADLDADQQRLARQTFLRLTALGEGTEDTRRRVNLNELETHGDPADGAAVIDRLVAARLLTLDEGTVEVAHEALIQAWPRLRRWLAEDRAGLRIHRQLTEATQAWQALDRDPGALHRGVRLAAAREWAEHDEHRNNLNTLERNFLDASIEQEVTEQAAVRRRNRQLRSLVAALTVLLVFTAGGAVWALRQRQAAISRQLAAEASSLAGIQPVTSALLSVEAFRLMPTPEARGALLSSSVHLPNRAVLNGHTSFVNAVAFSPDGRLLASAGGEDRVIILWDPARHTRLATLTGHASAVRDVVFSPDGHLLASASRDRTVMLWDVASRSRVAILSGHSARVNAVAFSPDGRLLASASDDHHILLWDVSSRRRIAILTGHTGVVRDVKFSPDGRTLASGGDDDTVMLWDLATRSRIATLTGHTDSVTAVAFSPDGHLLASASDDRRIMLWDPRRATVTAALTGHIDRVKTVAFSPDGRTLASGSNDRTVKLWDTATRRPIATLVGHSDWVSRVAFSPNGHALASSSGDQTVMVWSPPLPPFTGHTDAVNGITLSPDGRTLASASNDRTVLLWDLATRSRMGVLTGHRGPVNAVAFSPDGRTLASASNDRTVLLWDLATRSRIGVLTGHGGPVNAVAFSPDGRVLASASDDQTIALWDVARHSRLATLRGHTAAVTAVVFSRDGRQLVSTSADESVAFWDLKRRRLSGHLPMHCDPGNINTLALSPDGHLLATKSADRKVLVWDLATRTHHTTLQPAPIRALAFSADGHTLAGGGADGSVILWELTSRRRVATLTGHTEEVTGLVFPDAASLVSASADHGVIAWGIVPDQTAKRICAVSGRDLTRQEWNQLAPGILYHHTCTAPGVTEARSDGSPIDLLAALLRVSKWRRGGS